jgi:flagellar protein FlaG
VIIQFANNINQAEQSVRRVSDDAPKAVADTANVKPPLGGADGGQQPSSEQLKKAADNINQIMQQSNQNLEFEFTMDTDTKKTVVRVVDTKTGELIRQIPSEETLAIARSIDQFQHSLLLSQKA